MNILWLEDDNYIKFILGPLSPYYLFRNLSCHDFTLADHMVLSNINQPYSKETENFELNPSDATKLV